MGVKVTPSSPGLLWGEWGVGGWGVATDWEGKQQPRKRTFCNIRTVIPIWSPQGAESSWRQMGLGVGGSRAGRTVKDT